MTEEFGRDGEDRDEAPVGAPSESEQLEAELLAQALERGTGRGELPDDALEVAALLRYSRDGGAISESRLDALLEEAMRDAKPPVVAGGGRRRWWLPALSSVLALAVVLLVLRARQGEDDAELAERMRLPAPSAELLRAQAALAAGGAAAERAQLARAMSGYREVMLSSLEERYRR